MNLLQHKYYLEESVFKPENLLREAKRQKGKKDGNVPAVCVLDPDGDLCEYLMDHNQASINECWACYHSKMYNCKVDGIEIGIIPNIVGSSYAVLVAEQLFVSGCKYLISVTSAGIINHKLFNKRFALITASVRDEGTSYYAFAEAKQKNVVCFAHLTNTMAQWEGDFEKGEYFGSIDTLRLLSYLLKRIL